MKSDRKIHPALSVPIRELKSLSHSAPRFMQPILLVQNLIAIFMRPTVLSYSVEMWIKASRALRIRQLIHNTGTLANMWRNLSAFYNSPTLIRTIIIAFLGCMPSMVLPLIVLFSHKRSKRCNVMKQ